MRRIYRKTPGRNYSSPQVNLPFESDNALLEESKDGLHLKEGVAIESDVREFDRLFREWEKASTDDSQTLERLCSLYQGPFLGESECDDWTIIKREQYAYYRNSFEYVSLTGNSLLYKRVGLVQDGEAGPEQLHLEDLEALLLAAGEAGVDVALGEGGVHAQVLHGLVDLADPLADRRNHGNSQVAE